MTAVLKYSNALFVTVWLGSIIFFSFVLTPTLFKQLSKEVTSKVLDVIFPKYYLLGIICATGALITQLLGWVKVSGTYPLFFARTAVLIGMALFTFYAATVVHPEAHRLKTEMRSVSSEGEVPKEVRKAFKKSHRMAVLLNLGVLILGLFYLWLLVYSPSF